MKENNHFVPQFYLHNFSNNNKSIGMFRFKNRKYIPHASIRDSAYRKFLYGKNPIIEDGFVNLEGEWSTIIRKISETKRIDLNFDEYVTLLLFLTLSEARTSLIADYNNAFLSAELNAILQKKHLEDLGVQYAIPNLTTMQSAAKLTSILTDLSLLLLINKSNRGFITSDNPVVRYNQFFVSRNYDRQYGYGHMGMQLFMPLTPEICLCVYDDVLYTPAIKDIITINSGSQINELNKLFLLNAYECVFFNNVQKESYIRSLVKHRNEKNRFCIPILGSDHQYLIPYFHLSIKEKIKLSFFQINPDFMRVPLPFDQAGPLRPIVSEFIDKLGK